MIEAAKVAEFKKDAAHVGMLDRAEPTGGEAAYSTRLLCAVPILATVVLVIGFSSDPSAADSRADAKEWLQLFD